MGRNGMRLPRRLQYVNARELRPHAPKAIVIEMGDLLHYDFGSYTLFLVGTSHCCPLLRVAERDTRTCTQFLTRHPIIEPSCSPAHNLWQHLKTRQHRTYWTWPSAYGILYTRMPRRIVIYAGGSRHRRQANPRQANPLSRLHHRHLPHRTRRWGQRGSRVQETCTQSLRRLPESTSTASATGLYQKPSSNQSSSVWPALITCLYRSLCL